MDAFQLTINEVVEAVHSGDQPALQSLSKVRDAWEGLSPSYYGRGINLAMLGETLSDGNIIELGGDMVITDPIRLAHARCQLKQAYSSYQSYLGPNFHGSYITSTDGRSVLLISSEGHEFEPYGIFVDFAQFEMALQAEGFLLVGTSINVDDDQKAFSDDMILDAWIIT